MRVSTDEENMTNKYLMNQKTNVNSEIIGIETWLEYDENQTITQ